MKPKRMEVGDFVYCRSPYHREKLGIPKTAGLVLEVKRSNFRLLYGTSQFCWLPEESIVRIDGEVNTETLAGRLHGVIQRFRPLDCELVSDADLHQATLRIDHLDADLVDDVRSFLGKSFVALSVVPEGMAFMLAEIRFRT